MEIWKEIPGYKGYEASNLGNIRSLPKVNCKNYRILKQRNHKNRGYMLFTLKDKNFAVHRIIAITFLSNPENKSTINHKDGNKSNNHIDNLEWATPSENVLHSFKMGLRVPIKISKNRRRKISEFMKRRHKLGLVPKRGQGKTKRVFQESEEPPIML